MLKGIDPVLSPDLLRVLREMGHGDEIAIVDANYPAEAHAERLVRLDGIPATRLADAILSVLPLDDFVEETAFRPGIKGDPEHREPIMREFEAILERHEPGRAVVPLMGQAFYERVRGAYALVASGERRLYGNLILRKGVIRPDGD